MDLERARASADRGLADAQAEMRNLGFQSHREIEAAGRDAAEVAHAIAESEARRESIVKAPMSGMVTGLTVEEGYPVQSGQAMATMLQAGAPLEAELYAPSRSVGFIKPGMRAMIRHQAFAYQKFGQHTGTVREVSGIALRPEELPLHAGASAARSDGEPLYRVRITLDRQDVLAYGQAHPLKAGMALEASVILEERKLYEWILEPLFSVSGRFAK
jgi:membrane fusion protein